MLLDASGVPIAFEQRRDGGLMAAAFAHEASGMNLEFLALQDREPVAVADRLGPAGMQAAYEATFANPGILLVASMLAYLVAQLLDVFLYHFWRRVTEGRHLWLRNNGSTAFSQLVDTIIVNGIFLTVAFGMPAGAVVKVIVAVYICKLALALLDTPLIYGAVWLVKRRLGYAFDEDVPDLLHVGFRHEEEPATVPAAV
jgi:hypothetical protein